VPDSDASRDMSATPSGEDFIDISRRLLNNQVYFEMTDYLREKTAAVGLKNEPAYAVIVKSLDDSTLIQEINNSNKFLWESKTKYYIALLEEFIERLDRAKSKPAS